MARRAVTVACAAAFAIALFFIFVWAPHPYGWAGIDEYHGLALSVVRGDGFPTLDRPWGYAYFLAAFFRIVGDRPVVPLVAQAVLNAALPLMVYVFARDEFDEPIAAVAALLTGFLSFNTVYASTQASDSVCNVLFMAGVLAFARARRRGDWRLYVAAGALLGLAPQFRPNLILVAPVLAAFAILELRTRSRVRGAALVLVVSTAMQLPWIVRNERLTGELLPTSTHGGLQLWYGTLQTGPYLASRSYNPRAVFETPGFPYTSLDHVPLVLTARSSDCADAKTTAVEYWTDRDPTRRRVAFTPAAAGSVEATVPAAPAPTAFYFAIETAAAPSPPEVFFVSADHLGDLDRHQDLLDVFDVVRLVRHLVWNEPIADGSKLDLDEDGRLSENDVQRAVDLLLARATPPRAPVHVVVEQSAASAVLRLADESAITVPRLWAERVTDLDVRGDLGAVLVHTWVPFAQLRAGRSCETADALAINGVFYRAEPQQMRRYVALAFDNIRRDPGAYAASVVFRAVRVFLVEGSDDVHTAYQFTGSSRIYRAAWVGSAAFLVLCVIGIVAARRRGASIALPLLLIAYIPATLAFLLTNMRYSITVQPLMFMFVAAAIVSVSEAAAAGRRRGDIRTARQP